MNSLRATCISVAFLIVFVLLLPASILLADPAVDGCYLQSQLGAGARQADSLSVVEERAVEFMKIRHIGTNSCCWRIGTEYGAMSFSDFKTHHEALRCFEYLELKTQSRSVISVLDGETLRLSDGSRVGIQGVRLDQSVLFPDQKKDTSKEAEFYLKKTIQAEDIFIPTSDPNRELSPYGEQIVYIYRMRDGLFLNLEMIRQGVAYSDSGSHHTKKIVLEQAEREAKQNQRGAWSL
ncbi:MAG: thermonuclease family protein [Candidatus Omnitrophica bacterium]|nr:thermonuclease family protein [Candidatus Omnitrophota bacterium]